MESYLYFKIGARRKSEGYRRRAERAEDPVSCASCYLP